jgi:hypothetical protein
VNTHSGILYTTNNSFSWLSLARYQNDDTLRSVLTIEQCCGSGTFIPDPGSKNSYKRER